MSQYEIMRHFADSWGLLMLTLIFLFIVGFVMRRGSGALYKQAANIPLQDDTGLDRS